MLKVFITIDTEFYPLHADWRENGLCRDINRDIYGETATGRFGLSYQLNVLKAHGLKASFFVESLFASSIGLPVLAKIVEEVQNAGQEIQLHLHPEWLQWMTQPPIPSNARQTINQFSDAEQFSLISIARRNLLAAGAKGVRAFRAGDYAANAQTLSALIGNQILFDTSYNASYPNSLPDISNLSMTFEPRCLSGLWEFPVAIWQNRLGHRRHAQFCSCSVDEMKRALVTAWKRGWFAFVIVSHSFELLKNRRQRVGNPSADPIVVNRFNEICKFLANNRDRFQTIGFNDIDPATIQEPRGNRPLDSSLLSTGWRMIQQAYRRMT